MNPCDTDIKLSRMPKVCRHGKGTNMKLEELLGAELYARVKAKLDEANAKEPDKLKHIRYADLSEGEYVGKGKYDSEISKLNTLLSGKNTELETANKLIAELQKATKGSEEMQGKFTEYQNQVAKLQAQLAETKAKAALKVALLSEKATDIDYLTFKVNEKLKGDGKTLELDENGNIKGWNDIAAGLKTQFPNQFEKAGGADIDANPLPNGEHGKCEPATLADALRMQYENKK